MADTLCAKFPVNLIDQLTLIDCLIRAFRFAYITIDAVVSDKQGHLEDSREFVNYGIVHDRMDKRTDISTVFGDFLD